MNYLSVTTFLVLSASATAQQSDTILFLKAVEIEAPVQVLKNLYIDTLSLRAPVIHTLGRQLQFNSGLIIREYGAGGLATASFRGQDSKATDVFWHGIKLNSGLNGTFDFNQAPLFLFNRVEVAAGSQSLQTPSGGQGGAITLGNDSARVPLMVLFSMEQYNTYTGGIRSSGQVRNWKWHSGFISRSTLNNFVFQNPLSGKVERMDSARGLQVSGISGLEYKFSKKYIAGLHAFFQFSDNILPRHYAMPVSTEKQREGSIRTVFENNLAIGNSKLLFSAGIILARMRYTDPRIKVDDTSAEASFNPRIRFDRNIGNRWRYYLDNFAYKAYIQQDNYASAKSFFQNTGTAGIVHTVGRHKGELIFKVLTESTKFYLPLPSIHYSLSMSQHYGIRLAVGGTSMLPSANDKYWLPGGNDKLIPALGYQAEGGLMFSRKFKFGYIDAAGNSWMSRVNNRIEWVPDSNGIWGASNSGDAWFWGCELSGGYHYERDKFGVRARGGYHFNRSFLTNDSLRWQRPHIPKHRVVFSTGISWKKLNVDLYLSGQSERFQDRLKTIVLPAFVICDVFIGYSVKGAGAIIKASLFVRNFGNTAYTLVYNRPLPGRVGGLTLTFQL